MQNIQDGLLARIERILVLSPAFETDYDVVLSAVIQNCIADRLNRTVSQTRSRQALANLIDGRWTSEAHINQRATAEINAVAQAIVLENRGPSHDQQDQGQCSEIFRLPHPVNVNVPKKFHSDTYPPLFDTTMPGFVPWLTVFTKLNTEFRLAAHARQMPIENRARHVNRSEHVGQ